MSEVVQQTALLITETRTLLYVCCVCVCAFVHACQVYWVQQHPNATEQGKRSSSITNFNRHLASECLLRITSETNKRPDTNRQYLTATDKELLDGVELMANSVINLCVCVCVSVWLLIKPRLKACYNELTHYTNSSPAQLSAGTTRLSHNTQ